MYLYLSQIPLSFVFTHLDAFTCKDYKQTIVKKKKY